MLLFQRLGDGHVQHLLVVLDLSLDLLAWWQCLVRPVAHLPHVLSQEQPLARLGRCRYAQATTLPCASSHGLHGGATVRDELVVPERQR